MHAPTFLKCECPHCAQGIEYPPELASTTHPCPTCAGGVIFPAQAPTPKPVGLLAGLVNKYKERQQAAHDKNTFRDELFDAVCDGVLTEDEAMAIVQRKEEFGIDDAFLHKHAGSLLNHATKAIMADGYCSPDEWNGIEDMALRLGTSVEAHPKIWNELRRGRWRYQLRFGPPPLIEAPNVLLQTGEVAHWRESGTMYEEKVVRRRYEGGSRGVSFRIAKGVSFRVGNHRGEMVSETGQAPVSSGDFWITNKRLIFAGDRKSFSAPFGKIMHMEPATDGVRFSESNKQKPRVVLFDQPNGDLVFEVLARLVK